ncbi:MAG: hypothetical protein Kow0074_21480 [Candidatus Zixiibacteriota bacterium]
MAVNERKRKRIVYAVFVLAVIWGLYNQPWKRPERNSAPVASTSSAEAAAQVAGAAGVATTMRVAQTGAAPDWSVNPFRPISTEEPDDVREPQRDDVAPPELQGTMTVGTRQLCVLDGRVYRIGDQVGTWNVSRINAGQVTLTGAAGETVNLSTRKSDS